MTTTYKVLAQLNPTGNTATDLYTVPASTSTVVSTLSVCNQSTSTTFNVQVRKAGAASNNSQYIVFSNYVNQYDTVFLTLGITLANTDVVTVYASTSNVSFSLFGSEIT